MNNNNLISLIGFAILIVGCGGGGSDGSSTTPPPTPAPSLSVTITSASNYEERSDIELSSTIQNANGTILYSWEQVSGIALTSTATDQSTLIFSVPDVIQDEDVSFKLTVTDGSNKSASATVNFTIEDIPLGLALNSGFPLALFGFEDAHKPIIRTTTSQLDGSCHNLHHIEFI